MEIPTTGETLDNIVCYWQPEKAIKAGDELDFGYRLYWARSRRCVLRWRDGHPHRDGRFPEGWAPGEHYPDKWARRFAIDFVGGDHRRPRRQRHRTGDYLSNGEAKQIRFCTLSRSTAIASV